MTIEFIEGINRVYILVDLAIEDAILNERWFVFLDWQSRNRKGLEVESCSE